MPEGVVLEQPDGADEAPVQEPTFDEVPSVFSVITRYLIGGGDVSKPEEDGSRMLRLYAASGQAIIEASLSPQLCAAIAEGLTKVEVEIIEEGDGDAGAGE